MNKKDEVRKMLNSYLVWKNNIKIIELEIEELSNYGVSAMIFKEKTGQTYKINNEVESIVINKDHNIEQLQKEKRLNEINCEKMEKAINILKEFEKQVIELKYMTPPVMSWFAVARKIGFSQIACQRAEDRAIVKIIPMLVR